METTIIVGVIFVVLSYAIGNLSSGYFIGHFWGGIEVQESGSKAVGATNVVRVTGKIKYALATIFIDMFIKGTLWMFAVYYVFGILMDVEWVVATSFAAVLIGHIYPVLSKFKTRGKGIAILIGGLISLAPGLIFIIAGAGWFLTFRLSNGIMSLSNLFAISILLLGSVAFNPTWEFVVFAIFAAFLIYWAHRENIRKIWRREEGMIELKINWEKLMSWRDIVNVKFK